MTTLETVQPRKKHSLDFSCPNCFSTNVTVALHSIRQKVGDSKMLVSLSYDCSCQDCHHEYVIDAGKDEYTFYMPPRSVTNLQTPKLLMELKNNERVVLAIYSDICDGHLVHYMRYKESDLPLFISSNEVKTFLKEPEKAKKHAQDILITWYR